MAVKPTKILLVEDNPGDARLIKELLKDSPKFIYEMTHLNTISSLKEQGVQDFDVVLLDLNYDDMGGIKSFQYAARYVGHIPIIVLTGYNDEELGLEIVKRGAQDYLIKGEIDSRTLVRSIRYSIERKRSQSNLKIAEGKNRELQNEAILLQAEGDRLREINKTKDEFISLASHQLRTPATIVKQYLAMLRDGYAGELSDDQISYLEKAYETNEKQLHIVDDILAVARIDGANTVTRLKEYTLQPIIVEATNAVKSQLTNKNQKLTVSLPPDEVVGSVDATQLEMVLENILENASHYSPENTEIKLQLKDAQERIEISVADNGVGIEQKDIGKLFQKFSRIPNKYSVEVGGTGLGLYWANKIIGLHHGKIEVKSKVGKGTEFTVQLPVLQPVNIAAKVSV